MSHGRVVNASSRDGGVHPFRIQPSRVVVNHARRIVRGENAGKNGERGIRPPAYSKPDNMLCWHSNSRQ